MPQCHPLRVCACVLARQYTSSCAQSKARAMEKEGDDKTKTKRKTRRWESALIEKQSVRDTRSHTHTTAQHPQMTAPITLRLLARIALSSSTERVVFPPSPEEVCSDSIPIALSFLSIHPRCCCCDYTCKLHASTSAVWCARKWNEGKKQYATTYLSVLWPSTGHNWSSNNVPSHHLHTIVIKFLNLQPSAIKNSQTTN